MLTDIKVSKAQLFKIIQSGWFFAKTLRNMIGIYAKKTLLDFADPLPKNVLPKLATKATLSVLDKNIREKTTG